MLYFSCIEQHNVLYGFIGKPLERVGHKAVSLHSRIFSGTRLSGCPKSLIGDFCIFFGSLSFEKGFFYAQNRG